MMHLYTQRLFLYPGLLFVKVSVCMYTIDLIDRPEVMKIEKKVFFSDHSKAVLLLWIFFVSYASFWYEL